jgi:hypothetical protein
MRLGAAAALALSAALITSLGAGPVSAAVTTAGQASGGSPAASPARVPGTSTALPGGLPSLAAGAMQAALTRQHAAALAARRPGTVTGVIRSFAGQPLPGACVTAFGPAGTGTARAGAGGAFSVRGLAAGSYTLKYADCARPGEFLPQWSGAAPAPALGRRVTVRAGQPTAAGTVALQPASPAALTRESAAARHTRAAARPGAASLKLGGVSGRVTSGPGRPITRTCAEVHSPRGYFVGVPVSKTTGRWTIGKSLPPGRYTVEFAALDCAGVNPGNWAPQWYRSQNRAAKATRVRIRPGRITTGISGRLHHGGIISGIVTGRAGKRLDGVCAVLFTGPASFGVFRTTRDGRYSFRGLPAAGHYRILFEGSCTGQASPYLPQWWRGAHSFAAARAIRVRLGHVTRGISPRLLVGGKVTGIVRFRTAAGRPLRGICVDISTGGPDNELDFFATTGATGRYLAEGLPPGRSRVFFSPGCNNNGNFLSARYPRPLHIAAGRTIRGIDAVLQPGAIISGPSAAGARGIRLGYGQKVTGIDAALQPGATITGTVTSSSGQPAGQVCVSVQPVSEAYFTAESGGTFGYDAATSAAGRYRVRNLAAGRYAIQFFSCGGQQFTTRWFGGRPGSGIGDVVTVGGGATLAGIGAAMSPGGSISGTVRTSGGKPLQSACEIVTSLRTGQAQFGDIGFSSRYRVSGLAPGRYLVEFYDCLGTNYAIQWYKTRPGPGSATPVRVTAGHTTGSVNAALAPGGRITGG